MRPLTNAMLRELQAIDATGEPTGPADWIAAGGLWFRARDRVLSALIRRELIQPDPNGFALTAKGRAAIRRAEGK